MMVATWRCASKTAQSQVADMTVDQSRSTSVLSSQKDRHEQELWNHSSHRQKSTSFWALAACVPEEHVYRARNSTLACLKSRNKFPLIAYCRMRQST